VRQPAYPSTHYHPAPFVDLSAKAERERLSRPAVQAFLNIMHRWSVRDEQARALLGGLSNGPFHRWKREAPALVDTDVLTRISYLVGIFKALNIRHGESLADEWVRLSNTNRLFAGQTPLSFMVQGGIPAIETVRRLLAARRGGI